MADLMMDYQDKAVDASVETTILPEDASPDLDNARSLVQEAIDALSEQLIQI